MKRRPIAVERLQKLTRNTCSVQMSYVLQDLPTAGEVPKIGHLENGIGTPSCTVRTQQQQQSESDAQE